MIERVANELMKVHAEDIDHDEGLKIYYRMARSAIEAMREPSAAMIDAACSCKRGQTVGETLRDEYKAMIDAALQDS